MDPMTRRDAEARLQALQDRISNPCAACCFRNEFHGCQRTDGCAPQTEQLGWAMDLLREFLVEIPDPEHLIQRLGASDVVMFSVETDHEGTVSLRGLDGTFAMQAAVQPGLTAFPPAMALGEQLEIWGTEGVIVVFP